MSRIDPLLAALCPDGVEFSRVGDIATVGTGSSDRKDANIGGDYAFRDGAIPTAGTAITKILPPVSRFSKNNGHGVKKQTVLDKL